MKSRCKKILIICLTMILCFIVAVPVYAELSKD